MQGTSISKIHKELRKITTIQGLLLPSIVLVDKLAKKRVEDKKEYSLILLPFINKAYKSFNKPINQIVVNSREEAIDRMMDIASKSGRVFYLCSWHADSAEDHIDYQGGMYYDGNAKLSDEEQKYVNSRHIKTIQWVMNAPVYLLTRPHCRHYFMVLESSVVLSHTVNELLKMYDMIRPVGKRRTNAIIYAERKAFHQGLAKIQSNENLEAEIKKDSALINKWRHR